MRPRDVGLKDVADMNTTVHQGPARESAIIYRFPVYVRKATAGRRDRSGGVTDPTEQPVFDTAPVECWYHDAAVKQSAGLAKP
jgi:hypothetical protein